MNSQCIINAFIIFTCLFLMVMATSKKETDKGKEAIKTSETAHSAPHIAVLQAETRDEANHILHILNDIGIPEEGGHAEDKELSNDVEDKSTYTKEQKKLEDTKHITDPPGNNSAVTGETNGTAGGQGTTPAAESTTEGTLKTLVAPPLQTEGLHVI